MIAMPLVRSLRSLLVASALCLAMGCGGTLVDADGAARVLDAADANGAGNGLICAQDNQCLCDPCASNSECAPGLQCQDAKQHGALCGRRVCLSPGA